ncbi:hypothetical protein B0H13DRAFT_1888193 [Mycena leptocephala]|nr:hypothetical protein B0H13DRAFT_1888193 [Mycena leptocephala]
MPRPTKTQTKSDLIYIAERLTTASIAFEDDPDVEAMALFQDQEAYEADLTDDTSDLLGWCIMGILGTVKSHRQGPDLANTSPLQDQGRYFYMYDAPDDNGQSHPPLSSALPLSLSPIRALFNCKSSFAPVCIGL